MRAIAQTPTWCGRMLALLLVVGSLVLFMTPAYSAGNHQSFVKDSWYIGKGGKAVSLKDFAQNPRQYLRSEAAYTNLRDHLAKVVGKTTMSDAEFRDLLMGDKVRLVPCVGQIKTAGIKKDGVVNWFERACYKDEYLIEVQVPNGWVATISQGCLNPLGGLKLPEPAPTPDPAPLKVAPPVDSSPPVTKTADPALSGKTCGWVFAGTSTGSTQVIEMQGQILQSCLGPYLVPGLTQHIQGGSTVAYVWSCK